MYKPSGKIIGVGVSSLRNIAMEEDGIDIFVGKLFLATTDYNPKYPNSSKEQIPNPEKGDIGKEITKLLSSVPSTYCPMHQKWWSCLMPVLVGYTDGNWHILTVFIVLVFDHPEIPLAAIGSVTTKDHNRILSMSKNPSGLVLM